MDSLVAGLLAPLRWFESLRERTQDRLIGASLALPAGTVLGIARSLSPDPAGMGTHRQLGLGGCAFLQTTELPCPMCGMTTTFTHLAHLDVLAGTVNQPFGLVLFLGTVSAFSLGAADLLVPAGRWRRVLRWVDNREGWIAGGLMIGLVAGWAYKIAMTQGVGSDFLSSLP